MRRTILTLLLGLVATPSFAESIPVETPLDPHMTRYGERGDFVLRRYGEQEDGTLCPPTPFAIDMAIEGNGAVTFIQGFGVDQDTDRKLAGRFADSSCEVRFSGDVIISIHHGTHAMITPVSAEALADPPDFEGPMRIVYAPIACLVPPCPPGPYTIVSTDNHEIGQVDALVIEDIATGSDFASVVRGEFLDFELVEGQVWIDEANLPEGFYLNGGETRARLRIERHLDGLLESEAR